MTETELTAQEIMEKDVMEMTEAEAREALPLVTKAAERALNAKREAEEEAEFAGREWLKYNERQTQLEIVLKHKFKKL